MKTKETRSAADSVNRRSGEATPVKTTALVYGKDDLSPWGVSVSLGFQHLLVALMNLVYPILLMQEFGHSMDESRAVLKQLFV